jgi:hypothetical protein
MGAPRSRQYVTTCQYANTCKRIRSISVIVLACMRKPFASAFVLLYLAAIEEHLLGDVACKTGGSH